MMRSALAALRSNVTAKLALISAAYVVMQDAESLLGIPDDKDFLSSAQQKCFEQLPAVHQLLGDTEEARQEAERRANEERREAEKRACLERHSRNMQNPCCSRAKMADKLVHIEHGLQCPLCLKFYEDPVVVPCGHFFCRKCVEASESSKECPRCPRGTQLCSDSVEPSSLSFNLPLLRLSLAYRDSFRAQDEERCVWDSCEEPALYFCPKCEAAMCTRHRSNHDSNPMTKRHQLTHCGKIHCYTHSALYQLFCEDCDALVCSECIVGSHAGHRFASIHSVADKRRDQLTSKLVLVAHKQQELQGLLEANRAEKHRLNTRKQKIADKLQATREQRQVLDKNLVDLALEQDAIVRAIAEPTDQELLDKPKFLAMEKLIIEEIETELTSLASYAPPDILPPTPFESGLESFRLRFPSPSGSPLHMPPTPPPRTQTPTDPTPTTSSLSSSSFLPPPSTSSSSSSPSSTPSPPIIPSIRLSIDPPTRPTLTSASTSALPSKLTGSSPLSSASYPLPGELSPISFSSPASSSSPSSSSSASTSASSHFLTTSSIIHHAASRSLTSSPNKQRSPPGFILSFGATAVLSPRGIACNPRTGNIFVASFVNHMISVYSAWGLYLRSFGANGSRPGQFKQPIAVAVNDRDQLLVADYENHRVQILTEKGEFVREFGCHGVGPRQFRSPHGIAVDRRQRILVVDQSNSRVQVFDGETQFLFAFGSRGKEPGKFLNPSAIAIDPLNENIYVADTMNERVQVFDSMGKFLTSFTVDQGTAPFNPSGMTVDVEGNLAIVDHANNQVLFVDRHGFPVSRLQTGECPNGIACDNLGNFLITCQSGGVQMFGRTPSFDDSRFFTQPPVVHGPSKRHHSRSPSNSKEGSFTPGYV